jgi:membrane-associated phospholipid phosphatase
MNPYAYRVEQSKDLNVIWIMTFLILIFFPLLTTVLMKALKMIPSFQMEDKQDRIGPLIATIVFYVWYFINVKNDPTFPVQVVMISLGATICISIAFFVNNFSKVSLHAAGAGAFLMGLVLSFEFSSPHISISIFKTDWLVSPIFILCLGILLAGLIGTSRLILKAHKPDDLYGGYIIGILSMLISYKIIV